MISRELHVAIEIWVRADTWHTSHPCDDERFYALLAVVEFEGAHNVDVDGFIDVASELANRYHPRMKREFISENIKDKALQAEAIMGYIAFRRRHQI